MKLIASIYFSFSILLSFSQEKNCNTVNGPSASICDFEIWKEKYDTIYCVVKSNKSTWIADLECGFKYDLSKNKTWVFYSEDTLTIFEIVTIKDSVLNGENLKYYLNGSIKEKAFYVNGKLEGKKFKYYKKGQLEEYGEYKNGEVNGPLIAYYENSFIRWTSNNCDKHNVDVEYKYWDNMRLASVTFQMDKLGYYDEKIINMYFDPNGNSISEFEFKDMWYCNW